MEVASALSPVLASQEPELPILKQLGFSTIHKSSLAAVSPVKTSSSNYIHTNDPEGGHASSNAAALNANDSFSNSRKRSSPNLLEHPERMADQLASFLSRIKYVYDEEEAKDVSPLNVPVNSAFADQRSLIKAQAARVRNQLDLKFSTISFMYQMENFAENPHNGGQPTIRYNPLQTIRDRNKHPVGGKHIHRVNIWHVPVTEQIQDTKWRFRTSRMRAHKQKRKQRRGTNVGKEGLDKENVATPNTQPQLQQCIDSSLLSTPDAKKPTRERATPPSKQTTCLAPGYTGSPEGPTQKLPKSECTELIERLRSSHSHTSDERDTASSSDSLSNSDNSNSTTKRTYVGPASNSTQAAAAANPEPEKDVLRDSETDEDEASGRGPSRFCRNLASVNDTWNRLYRFPSDGSAVGQEECGMKPLIKVTSATSGISSSSEALIVDGEDSRPPMADKTRPRFGRGSTSSSVSELMQCRARSRLNSSMSDVPLMLTVTNDNGEEKVLDEARISTKSRNNSAFRKDSYSSELPDLKFDGHGELGEGFGSLRAADVRRDPCERTLCNLEADLRFLIPFYKLILRREDPALVYKKLDTKLRKIMEDNSISLSEKMESETVRQFLKYLSRIEHSVLSEQQSLDAEIASALDGLRVSTDLLVSDVNTTLSRRVREASSRMERLYNCRECGIATTVAYMAIEYGVLFLMWLIWCGVQFVKPLKWILSIVQFLCINLIVA